MRDRRSAIAARLTVAVALAPGRFACPRRIASVLPAASSRSFPRRNRARARRGDVSGTAPPESPRLGLAKAQNSINLSALKRISGDPSRRLGHQKYASIDAIGASRRAAASKAARIQQS